MSSTQSSPRPPNRLDALRRALLPLAAVAAVLGLMTPSAYAWGWHRWSPPEDAAELRERMSWGADRLLGMADATEAQEKAFNALLDDVAPDAWALRQRGQALRERMMTALGRQKVDSTELEGLRVEMMKLADEASVRGLAFVADAANVLTPAQRAELIELWERWRR